MTVKAVFKEAMRGHWGAYVLGLSFLMLINILMLLVPHIIGQAVDTLNHGKDGLWQQIVYLALIMVLVALLKSRARLGVLGSIRSMEFVFRKVLCSHALRISISYYEQYGPGKVMALMTNDVTSIRVAMGLGVMIVVDLIFFSGMSIAILASSLALVTVLKILAPLGIILTLIFVLGQSLRKAQRAAQASYSDITEFTQELFQGIKVIRAFSKEGVTEKRFRTINQMNYQKNMKVVWLESLMQVLTIVAPLISMGLSLYVCGRLLMANQMTVGEFVSINAYILMILGPIIGLGSLVTILQKGLASLDRIQAFLQVPLEKEDTGEAGKEVLSLGPLECRHLTYSYRPSDRGPNHLEDVHVVIQPGEFVGIVGAPGSGKTTLFKLLLRLQEPPHGMIFINGQDIRDMSLDLLRNSIAYVPSEAHILSASLKENIAFGNDLANHISVEEAAKRADLVRDMGEHLQGTGRAKSVREKGIDLSGGQRQRVVIARAFYKNAPYVLLDDAFSALDPKTANSILQALHSQGKQTILFISQRVEAVRHADRILVFKDGRIVEAGTHQELLAAGGQYTLLYAHQEEGRNDA